MKAARLTASIERHGVDKALLLHKILIHCPFVPDLIDGALIILTEALTEMVVLHIKSDYCNVFMIYPTPGCSAIFEWNSCQRVRPLCVARKATVMPNRCLNSCLLEQKSIY